MDIWIVSDGEPLPIDGDEIRLRRMGNLANILSQRGHKIKWISSNFQHYTKKFRSSNDTTIEMNKNYDIQLLATKGYKRNISFSRMRHYKTLAQKFKKFAEENSKPDIILCTMAPIEIGEEVRKYCVKNNVKYVIDIRDLWPVIYYEVTPKYLHFLVFFLVKRTKKKLKRILKNSTGIVGVTRKFLDYGLDIAKINERKTDTIIHTAYPGEDIYENKNNFNTYWSKYGLKQNDFLVTFVGNFGVQFELDPIKEVIKNLQETNIKFVLCGTGSRLEQFREEFTNNKKVVIPGWVNNKEISSLLTNSSLGLAPYVKSKNYEWNYPNKFGEYLASGLPILLSVNGVMGEFVNENSCGKVYSTSEDLTDKIMSYYNAPLKLKEESCNAREQFEKNFDVNTVYNEFAVYLESI